MTSQRPERPNEMCLFASSWREMGHHFCVSRMDLVDDLVAPKSLLPTADGESNLSAVLQSVQNLTRSSFAYGGSLMLPDLEVDVRLAVSESVLVECLASALNKVLVYVRHQGGVSIAKSSLKMQHRRSSSPSPTKGCRRSRCNPYKRTSSVNSKATRCARCSPIQADSSSRSHWCSRRVIRT